MNPLHSGARTSPARGATFLGLALVALALVTAGCREPAAPAGGGSAAAGSGGSSGGGPGGPVTGVVDLDEVARRTGLDSQLRDAVKQGEATLNAQLQQIQKKLQEQLNAKAEEIQNAPRLDRPRLERELQALKERLERTLQASRLEARQKLSAHTQTVVVNLKQMLRPVVEDVAREAGYDIVLLANPDLVYVHTGRVDITDAVIQRLLVARQDAAASPAPASSPRPADDPGPAATGGDWASPAPPGDASSTGGTPAAGAGPAPAGNAGPDDRS